MDKERVVLPEPEQSTSTSQGTNRTDQSIKSPGNKSSKIKKSQNRNKKSSIVQEELKKKNQVMMLKRSSKNGQSSSDHQNSDQSEQQQNDGGKDGRRGSEPDLEEMLACKDIVTPEDVMKLQKCCRGN